MELRAWTNNSVSRATSLSATINSPSCTIWASACCLTEACDSSTHSLTAPHCLTATAALTHSLHLTA